MGEKEKRRRGEKETGGREKWGKGEKEKRRMGEFRM